MTTKQQLRLKQKPKVPRRSVRKGWSVKHLPSGGPRVDQVRSLPAMPKYGLARQVEVDRLKNEVHRLSRQVASLKDGFALQAEVDRLRSEVHQLALQVALSKVSPSSSWPTAIPNMPTNEPYSFLIGDPPKTAESRLPSAEDEAAAERKWQDLVQQGESARVRWLDQGLLVRSEDLARAWGRSRQALEKASGRGQLFSLKVGKNRYYPAAFKALEAEAVKGVCVYLRGEDAVAKFIFWNKAHGSLGGLTPADAIREGKGDKVARLAKAWSAERGLNF